MTQFRQERNGRNEMTLRTALIGPSMVSLEAVGNAYVIRSGERTVIGPMADEATALRRFDHLVRKGN